MIRKPSSGLFTDTWHISHNAQHKILDTKKQYTHKP